jgi:hypothetical protein
VSVSAIASKSLLNWSADNTPLQESAQQLDRFLQQNLPQPDITPVLRTAGISNLRRLRPSGAGFLDLTRFKEAGTARFAKPFSATNQTLGRADTKVAGQSAPAAKAWIDARWNAPRLSFCFTSR